MKTMHMLILLADELDYLGFHKEADHIDTIIKNSASIPNIKDLNLTPEEIAKFKSKDPTVLQKVWRFLTQWAPEDKDDKPEGNATLGVRG